MVADTDSKMVRVSAASPFLKDLEASLSSSFCAAAVSVTPTDKAKSTIFFMINKCLVLTKLRLQFSLLVEHYQ